MVGKFVIISIRCLGLSAEGKGGEERMIYAFKPW